MPDDLKRILCIDDDRDILDVAKICLELVGGYEVLTCDNGMGAIECIRQKEPQIVLLDVMMPEMDGPTIIKALQADPALRSIPVIFMTARVQPREVEEYLDQGAIAVVAKPFDPMELSKQVRDAWEKACSAPKLG